LLFSFYKMYSYCVYFVAFVVSISPDFRDSLKSPLNTYTNTQPYILLNPLETLYLIRTMTFPKFLTNSFFSKKVTMKYCLLFQMSHIRKLIGLEAEESLFLGRQSYFLSLSLSCHLRRPDFLTFWIPVLISVYEP